MRLTAVGALIRAKAGSEKSTHRDLGACREHDRRIITIMIGE
jgi:hypothetical protein